MDAIELLMSEHRRIEEVLAALEGYVVRVERVEGDRAELGSFVEFLRSYADAHHHGKEEALLFAAMVEAGFPSDGGPIGVMLNDHEEGRAHVRALGELAREASPWNEEQRRQIAQHARGFTSLLTSHIWKEDARLYPMAVTHLEGERLQALNDAVASFEAQHASERERLEALGERLARSYSGASARPVAAPRGCQHF